MPAPPAMIVLDLDNTLLRGDKTLSAYTVSVLDRCRAAGIVTVYATARSAQASRNMVAAFTPDAFIGYGGALTTSGDAVIARRTMPADVTSALIRDCLDEPAVTGILAISEGVALASNLAVLEADKNVSQHYVRADFSKEEAREYLKISVYASDPAAVERIAKKYPLLDMLRYSGEDLYRFVHRDALKWNAVQAAARHFGVDTARVAAFGDDLIDLEMIQNCGIGVAVRNAVPEVLSAADCVCGSNEEDGVAKWLEFNALCAIVPMK